MRLRYSTDSLRDAQTIAIWYECAEPGLNQLFLSDLMLTQIRIVAILDHRMDMEERLSDR
jgi:hypothetical protein